MNSKDLNATTEMSKQDLNNKTGKATVEERKAKRTVDVTEKGKEILKPLLQRGTAIPARKGKEKNFEFRQHGVEPIHSLFANKQALNFCLKKIEAMKKTHPEEIVNQFIFSKPNPRKAIAQSIA